MGEVELYATGGKMLDNKQSEETGKYFLDISKLIVGIYVFTTNSFEFTKFIIGIAAGLTFYIAGIVLIKIKEDTE